MFFSISVEMSTLYEEMRDANPHKFRVDPHSSLTPIDFNGLKLGHPCFGCIVWGNRTPQECDNCDVNPDRARLERAGLISKLPPENTY